MAWVVFNEGWGQFDTDRVTAFTKLYDPTRLVDDASGWNDRKVGDVIDMHNYPGPGAPESDGKRALVLGRVRRPRPADPGPHLGEENLGLPRRQGSGRSHAQI